MVVGGRSVHQPVSQPDGSKRFAACATMSGVASLPPRLMKPARSASFRHGPDEIGATGLDAILLPANFEAYRDYSRRFKAAVAGIAR